MYVLYAFIYLLEISYYEYVILENTLIVGLESSMCYKCKKKKKTPCKIRKHLHQF